MCQRVIFDFSILFSGGSLFPGGPARPLALNRGCDSPFGRAELDLCIPALLSSGSASCYSRAWENLCLRRG